MARKPVKVLLVDDELSVQKMIERRLSANGYEVVTANDGRHAIQFALEHSPDVIVMDIIMPDMNGDDVAYRLRKDKKTAHIPIIFLTCLVKPNEALASDFVVGENVMLPKPTDSARLISMIEKAVGN